ncbi:serine kinase [Novosphingobium sp. AAP83]|uniref:HPr kinase/phosphorylase n=1 Tax=Novosphingobium sp. AAP83 TaxID=1523425 RepID=UPI0006B9FA39|nr:HPr kinase/phosphatase C-terminal domain-containing protein [Novosphingobium sp. AAP83]KPF93357.1 serine kinase [Novosphingobium sp. AAP83]
MSTVRQATCVAIGGRGLLIEGAPASGKSSLALALIDRGAMLLGDDGVMLSAQNGRLIAAPHPNTIGTLEVRNVGLVDMPVSSPVPVALVISLDGQAPRFIESAATITIGDVPLPWVKLYPDSPVLALRAEIAMRTYGLMFS